jgi:glycopeptide antibiotics resistance protein
MKKIINYLSNLFPTLTDKQKHFIYGLLFCLISSFIMESLLVGIIFVVISAIWKEYWDSRGNGKVELMDAIATILGGAIGALIYELLSKS